MKKKTPSAAETPTAQQQQQSGAYLLSYKYKLKSAGIISHL